MRGRGFRRLAARSAAWLAAVRRCGAVVAVSLASVLAPAARAASPAPVAAENGMVVTAQRIASEVGVDILRGGGNAVDAAVAVGYALAVVYPAAGNLGGGGFMTLQLADGRSLFLDFRETAPLAATHDLYLDAAGRVRPGASTVGHLAVAVPGTVAGLETARARWGTRPRAELIAPAIRLAEEGYVLDAGDAAMFAAAGSSLAADPATAAIFLRPDGAPWRAGDRLVQRDLARTLRRIADAGAGGFYRGPVGEAIVAASRAGGGILAAADLESYLVGGAKEREPIRCRYRGLDVVSAPPPSSGGIVLCQMLQVLEAYPLGEEGWRAARGTHAQIEAMRHAFRDRNAHLGDPDFVPNPAARLLDPAHVARIRQAIDAGRAMPTLAAGAPSPGATAANGADKPGNTTHYVIADRQGNAVSVTVTLNGWFGAKVTAGGTGVLLNNEMDDFTVKAGVPNLYGLVQGEANAIAPGKRPLSSMTPTIVLRDGRPWLVVGTPGGSRIITVVLQVIVNMVDHGMDVQEAIDAPRLHQQWQPPSTQLEPRALGPDAQRILEAMGHVFAGPQPANHAVAIVAGAPALRGRPDGRRRYFGANDPRRGTGLALGY